MYVMLTVMVGFDGSGNSRNRRPLGRLYSVMPSTRRPLDGADGRAGRLSSGGLRLGRCLLREGRNCGPTECGDDQRHADGTWEGCAWNLDRNRGSPGHGR